MKRLITCLLFIAVPSFAQMPKNAGDLCDNETWEAYKYNYASYLIDNSPSALFPYRDTYCKNVGKMAWSKNTLPGEPPLGIIKGAFLAMKGQLIDVETNVYATRNSWWYIVEDKSISPEPWLLYVNQVLIKP